MIIANDSLPEIPSKRYFTIGEVSELCDVKPHVLRYWEQEFAILKPVKRRGNRRYYQQKDVILVRRIRNLLYEQGYTISGARVQLDALLNSSEAHSTSAQSTQTLREVVAELELIVTSLKP
ncbi:MAG: MerR family transcriptional regulator [Pseudomonadales bacterium]|nr:MerR family transcriptional regulator [Pseudomonadales bacterium]